jgi:3D (Asp-Asp-Asp) domain-containing protein
MGTPVKKVLAVNLAWYKILKGTQIYVPGYGIGTVQDTDLPYSSYWIDLVTRSGIAAAGPKLLRLDCLPVGAVP